MDDYFRLACHPLFIFLSDFFCPWLNVVNESNWLFFLRFYEDHSCGLVIDLFL